MQEFPAMIARSDSSYAYVLLLQRILNVEYGFPAQVEISDSCKDLLTGILVADPAQRMSIPQIMQHPWCVSH